MKLWSILTISKVFAYYEPGVDLIDCSGIVLHNKSSLLGKLQIDP